MWVPAQTKRLAHLHGAGQPKLPWITGRKRKPDVAFLASPLSFRGLMEIFYCNVLAIPSDFYLGEQEGYCR